MSEEKRIVRVSGMSKSSGNLECDEVKVEGMFRVSGDIKASDLTCEGMVRIAGDVNVESIDVEGMIKVGGDINVKSMDIDGLIKARSISGEKIDISGGFNVKENINCDTFIMELCGNGSVTNIEGSSVEVTTRRKRHHLKANTISADEINIENVKCHTISGDKVKIGVGCKVDNITYITSLDIDPNATVKKSQKAV
ncbi:polymer-forming cytoskeletal protein [Mycoplasmatota bacterium]|nr:polymer-forming cytoskeletal protein [Mycoplasmatota bacterium]